MDRLVFVNAAHEFLMSELPPLFPKNRIVFKLASCTNLPDGLYDRIYNLRKNGYRIALTDYDVNDSRKSLLPLVNYVMIGIKSPSANNAFISAQSKNIIRVASGVDTPVLLDSARELGFESYQGNYFAYPSNMQQDSGNSKLDVLNLIGKLSSEGSDKIIEDFFKSHPLLTIDLLRLVNAASSGHSREINSIHQALWLLGRSTLVRYFQLLLYGLDDRYACPSPLMAAAAWRGKFMELMVSYDRHTKGSNLEDQAYMVGMLSMISALFDQDISQLLNGLNLSPEICDAVLKRTGYLGKLLHLAEVLQLEDLQVVEQLALEQNQQTEMMMHAQNIAFAWVQQFQINNAEAS
jgi:EAL and modified HD-GYP domain-containing signal transduction protein